MNDTIRTSINDSTNLALDTLVNDSVIFSDSIKNSLNSKIILQPNTDNYHSGFIDSLEQVGLESGETILGLDYSFARILIPVVVTLVVFSSGQLVSWLKTKLERLNELKSIKITIEQWIVLIKPSIQAQVNACTDFATALTNSTNIHPESFGFTPLLVDKLQQIELRELIDTITVNLKGDNEKKAKLLFNFISKVEYLSKMENHIRQNYDKFHSYTFELMENWNQSFIRMNSIMNETSRLVHQVEPNCQFVRNKNQICNTFIQHTTTQSLIAIFDDFLVPLENAVTQYLNTSQNKQLVVNLAYNIEELKTIKNKWELHKQGHIQLANEYGTRISTAYGALEGVANQLKKSKFKFILNIK